VRAEKRRPSSPRVNEPSHTKKAGWHESQRYIQEREKQAAIPRFVRDDKAETATVSGPVQKATPTKAKPTGGV
jgi:hypothetical protein